MEEKKIELKNEGRYHKGLLPIPDKVFTVSTIKDGKIVQIGKVLVIGQEVAVEMDKAQSIKGHMHASIAQTLAEKKYPKANPIIVTPQ